MGRQFGASLLQFATAALAADPAGDPGTAGGRAAAAGDPADRKLVYTGACTVCHGATGKGGTHGGAPLTTALTHDAVITVLTNGRNQMPAFGSSMPAQDREEVAAYVLQTVK